MRKEADLEYTQNIELYFKGDEKITDAMNKWVDYIKTETLSTVIKAGSKKDGVSSDWDIDGTKITLTIVPLENKK